MKNLLLILAIIPLVTFSQLDNKDKKSKNNFYKWDIGINGGVNVNNPLSDSAGDYYEKAPEPFYSHPIPFEKNDFSYWEKLKKNLKDQEIQLIAYSSNKNEVII